MASEGHDLEALALIYAFRGNTAALQALVEQNVDFRIQDEEQRTPLILAARHRHLPALRLILRVSCLIDAEDEEGWTALHYAIRWGSLPAIELLLAHGARVHGLFGLHRNETLLHTVVRAETDPTFPLLEYFVCALGCDPFYCPPNPQGGVEAAMAASVYSLESSVVDSKAPVPSDRPVRYRFETPYALAMRLGKPCAVVLNNYALNRAAWLAQRKDRIEDPKERCTREAAATAMQTAGVGADAGGIVYATSGYPLWGADGTAPSDAVPTSIVPVASHPLLDRMNQEWYHSGLDTAMALASSF